MTEFKDILESYQASGSYKSNRMKNPVYLKKLAETNNFIEKAISGEIPGHILKEAMGSADFPILLGDNLNSRLLAAYQGTPASYPMWCSIDRNVPDFRTMQLKYVNTSNTLSEVKEGQAGKEIPTPTEGKYEYQVKTYEERMQFPWEMLVNDNLNAFQTLPQTLGEDARNTVEKFATSLICDASGPDATFFTQGQGNLITDTLSTEGLRAGIKAFKALRGPSGEPLNKKPAILAVVPALEETALDILGASTQFYANQATGNSKTVGFTLQNDNRYSGLKLAVLEWAPNVITGEVTTDDTSWFLFADPSAGRGAVELGFLRGIGDQPIVMKKRDDAEVMGGISAPIGSFDTRSYEYKVVHCFGGCTKDYRYAVASTGAGS